MSDKLTVKEALEQGYVYYGQDKGEYQHLHSIEHVTETDFEGGPIMIAEKHPYHTPSFSNEEIGELLADNVASWNGDMTGDDTDDVYNIVKALDFTAVANMVNEALKGKQYYELTKIQLIPNPVVSLVTVILLFLASCSTPKYYNCPKYVGIAIDTIPSDSLLIKVDPFPTVKPDTFPVMLQVSNNKPMRVCYAIPGYVVLNGDTVYLDRYKKALDPRLTVWQFKQRRDKQ